VNLNDEGFLEKYDSGLGRYTFIVDLSTGLLRLPGNNEPADWSVIRPGSETMDWILAPSFLRCAHRSRNDNNTILARQVVVGRGAPPDPDRVFHGQPDPHLYGSLCVDRVVARSEGLLCKRNMETCLASAD